MMWCASLVDWILWSKKVHSNFITQFSFDGEVYGFFFYKYKIFSIYTHGEKEKNVIHNSYLKPVD